MASSGWSIHPSPTTLSSRVSLSTILQFSSNSSLFPTIQKRNLASNTINFSPQTTVYCSNSTLVSPSETEEEEVNSDNDGEGLNSPVVMGSAPPLRQRRRRYRKLCPGEKTGITEEMRFIAMKLRNGAKPRRRRRNVQNSKESVNGSLDDGPVAEEEKEVEDNENGKGETWQPSMEGFLKYLVDSQLVFSTIERIVDESSDVSYAYFRKTGLERSECLLKDLEWLSQGRNVIPKPSNPGVTYAKYLEELGEQSPNLFLCHFYNIYFSHIAGGQLITKKVCENLLEGREVEFCRWQGEEEELLRAVRENLNTLGEHWCRDEKNKCLREATKAFRFLGQIVRLIIL